MGLLSGALFYYFGKKQLPLYTTKATLFPLTAGAEKTSNTSKLTELIGGNTGSKSLSEEANVNIEEVAKSRKTREAVCAEKLADFDNKIIAEILINEYNKQKGYFAETIEIPKSKDELIKSGASLLEDTYTAKFNKQNLLEIYYNNKKKELLTPVSYVLVAKISQFYKELKIKKAKIDYDFMQKKYDSLSSILTSLDQKQISVDERTLFVKNKMKYMIPVQNIQNDRLQIQAQKNSAAANLEEAHWRLEKVTPVIEILDKPEPPFKITKTSAILYGAVGFAVGLFLTLFLFTAGLLLNFSKYQINQTIESKLTEQKPVV